MKNTHELTNGELILTIGDPHLGRLFTTNVPLEARGVRERQLRELYVKLLNTKGVKYICMMGDLFDKFDVPNEVILTAWYGLMTAALANPNTTYIFNRGNHDESRDKSLKSSWSVFKEMADQADLRNVIVMGDEPIVVDGDIGVIPWHPFKSPKEMAEELQVVMNEWCQIRGPIKQLQYLLTHNDVSTYGSDHDPQNLMEFEALAALTRCVLNGHVHVATIFNHETQHGGKMKVINTGSMMPLTFAEDKSGDLFVTLTLEEFEAIDTNTLKDKSVRVVLKPDEEAPDPIECLQFKIKRVNEKGKDEVGEVKPEDFELKTLFDTSMEGVADPLKTEIWESIKDKL